MGLKKKVHDPFKLLGANARNNIPVKQSQIRQAKVTASNPYLPILGIDVAKKLRSLSPQAKKDYSPRIYVKTTEVDDRVLDCLHSQGTESALHTSDFSESSISVLDVPQMPTKNNKPSRTTQLQFLI